MVDASIVGNHEPAHFVRCLNIRTLLGEGDLNRGRSPVNEVGHLVFPGSLQGLMNLSGVDLTLNHIQYRHVLALSGGRTHHDILGQQQSPDHVQHSGLPDVGNLSVHGQGRVPSHQEVAPGRRHQGGQHAHHVIIHVAGVSECGSGGGHHCGDQGVDLAGVGLQDLEPVNHDSVEGGVVQHHNRVRILYEPFHGEHGVVGLYDHIGHVLILVGEHRVGRDYLLGELLIELLQEIAAHAAAGSTCDRVQHYEPLQAVGAVCLPVDHLHDFLLHLLALRVATGPVVAGAAALLGDEDILGVVELGVGASLDGVDDSGLQVDKQGAGHVVVVVCLVEEDVLAVLDLVADGVLLEDAGGADAVLAAELLPELAADWVRRGVLWLPHWPIWRVMISRGI